MKRSLILLPAVALTLIACRTETTFVNNLTMPAYPLFTLDPYTSVWSMTDNLADSPTKHWSSRPYPMIGALRVDGNAYRFMGEERAEFEPIVTAAAHSDFWRGQYTFYRPADGWYGNNFDDRNWKHGKAAFGTKNTPYCNTEWTSRDIWVRRSFDLPDDINGEQLYLYVSHDDNCEVYINGIEAAKLGSGYNIGVTKRLPQAIVESLKSEGNVLAMHCCNTGGDAYVDLGIMKRKFNGSEFTDVAVQKSVNLLPNNTIYTFDCGAVELEVSFTSTFVADDLDMMGLPYNYLSYRTRSTDGCDHDVELYLEVSGECAVEDANDTIDCEKIEQQGVVALKVGSQRQKMFTRLNDGVKIDWGYLYLAAKPKDNIELEVADCNDAKRAFISGSELLPAKSTDSRSAVLVYRSALGEVDDRRTGDFVVLGYDDIGAIDYFGDTLRPYWNRSGDKDMCSVLADGIADYRSNMHRIERFDRRIIGDAIEAGGQKYAELCAAAYRQTCAAHKLVEDTDGNTLYLSRENHSGGFIATVDVTYPSSPLYLCYNTELLKGMLTPIFYFCESGRWPHPFAPHDLGIYPVAGGQLYGEGMPVEESGNMLILTAAIAHRDGSADYAAKHWATLTEWAEYLIERGLDPENQLCTDDFAGHLAHNTNLSIKAIMGIASYSLLADMQGDSATANRYMGIASYSLLADMQGDSATANRYMTIAREMAAQWCDMADDGDHYRLAFDREGSWSQKYNLIWDKLLGFDLFPDKVRETEVAWYLAHQNTYGLPLDNRADYTKSDWIVWTACLTGDRADFDALIEPVWCYIDQTETRLPLSDWHNTITGLHVGFQARSVVGGYFMKVLVEE